MEDLEALIGQGTDIEAFFGGARAGIRRPPGHRHDLRLQGRGDRGSLVRKVRCLVKLIDELAKGKPMEKILR
jgi:hypothetical protein